MPFSCKRRMACPSCDAKRAVVESGRALEELLPRVPYRQWVLVLPKRRWFVNRDARLAGEISKILYQVSKTTGGPSYHEWPAAEFVGRMAALVPPPRKHVVRYYGALGPRSPLRSAVTEATRGMATQRELESGYSVTIAGKAAREVRKAASAAKRAWAACLRKIFEVDAVRCVKCGGGMKLVAVILDDQELDRILANQGWPTEFPKTKASRAPPGSVERGDANSQADPWVDRDGRQDFPSEWPA